jgi:peptide/nickel transport system permease protein
MIAARRDRRPPGIGLGWFRRLGGRDRVGLAAIFFWVLVAVFGPWFMPFDPWDTVADFPFASDDRLWLGADYIGRDVASRIVWGGRTTLALSLTATLLTYLIGTTLGICAATLGGWTDAVLSRANDILLSLPNIMLALLVIAAFGTSNAVVVSTTAVVFSSSVFRFSRALAMNVMVQDYVEVAVIRGERFPWIVFHEVLPNIAMPMLSDFGVRLVFVMLFISGLSFIGLGVQPPTPDWGSMVRENIQGLSYGAYAALWPAGAIASFALAVNLVVDDLSARSGRDITRTMR